MAEHSPRSLHMRSRAAAVMCTHALRQAPIRPCSHHSGTGSMMQRMPMASTGMCMASMGAPCIRTMQLVMLVMVMVAVVVVVMAGATQMLKSHHAQCMGRPGGAAEVVAAGAEAAN